MTFLLISFASASRKSTIPCELRNRSSPSPPSIVAVLLEPIGEDLAVPAKHEPRIAMEQVRCYPRVTLRE